MRGANYTARLAVGQFTAKRAPGVIPLLQKHGVEILVADYEPKTLEGESRGVNVVLRFESEEAAMAWYHDPDLRASEEDSTGFLVEGHTDPRQAVRPALGIVVEAE